MNGLISGETFAGNHPSSNNPISNDQSVIISNNEKNRMFDSAGSTITRVKQGASLSGEIIIPSKINGVTIKTVGDGSTSVFAGQPIQAFHLKTEVRPQQLLQTPFLTPCVLK